MIPDTQETFVEQVNEQSKRQATSLSIVIPVYNEKATIRHVIDTVRRASMRPMPFGDEQPARPLDTELVIVDDCSKDGTREVLQHLAQEFAEETYPRIRVLFHDVNQGKGAAVRTGIKAAANDIVLIQDADLEYDPHDYPVLLQPILAGRADAVFGNRFDGGGVHRVLYFWHYVANRALTLFCNMLTDLNLTDMEVGYKAFRREIFDQFTLKSNRFGFEPEVTIKTARLRCRIYEVPVSYYGRTYAEGKKIGWKDGVAAIYHMLHYRFFD